MALDELFYKDAYLQEFDAEVVACEPAAKGGFDVFLSDTAFYPEGGGQPADHGFLDKVPVTDTIRLKDGRIAHRTATEIAAGTKVHGKLDWDRRFDNMQNHTGEHLLSGLVHKKFGYDNVGFHMDDDLITVDFDGLVSDEEIAEIEKQSNLLVAANEAVDICFPSPEELKALEYRSKKELTGKVRIVTVGSADRCACCGTHVRTTGEIGIVKVLSCSKHRGGVRVEFVCGGRAIRDYQRRLNENADISHLLSAKPGHIADSVRKTLADLADRDAKIAAMNERYFAMRAETLANAGRLMVLAEDGLKPLELKNFANLLVDKDKADVVAVVSAAAPGVMSFVLRSEKEDMRALSKAVNPQLEGRGGGSPQCAQGTWKAELSRIEEVLRAALP